SWTIRNRILLGSATNRVIAFHPIGWTHLRDGARAAMQWLLVDKPIHPFVTAGEAMTALAVVVAAAVIAIRRRRERRGQLAGAMVIFIGCFAILLVVSISLVDYHTPVDTRVLAPIYAAWVVLVGCILAEGRSCGRTMIATWSLAGLLAL